MCKLHNQGCIICKYSVLHLYFIGAVIKEKVYVDKKRQNTVLILDLFLFNTALSLDRYYRLADFCAAELKADEKYEVIMMTHPLKKDDRLLLNRSQPLKHIWIFICQSK